MIYGPGALAVDRSGGIYISDFGNLRVRKVSAGIISTFAGSGSGVSSGDGGPAIKAGFSTVGGLAFDSEGNLYICDFGAVRRVSPSGIISRFAGNGIAGISGDGGPATSASVIASAIAIDSADNVYIADVWNGVVRKVTSGIISTIAGQAGKLRYSGDGGPATSATLSSPSALAFDGAGNLLISDVINDAQSFVRKVDVHGNITTIAGGGNYFFPGDGGPAINAALVRVTALAVDASGNIFIADADRCRIRMIAPNGIITTAAGNGSSVFAGDGGLASNASIGNPGGLVTVGNNIYVSDSLHNMVRLLTPGAPAAGPPPAISKGGVVTLFTNSSTIEAFSWVSIYGSNLIAGSAPVTWNGDYPLSLGGVTVTVNNKPAFLSYVSPTQVNILTPVDASAGTVNVALTNNNGTATGTATLASLSPAFSLLDGKHAAAIILRADGSGGFGGGTYDVVGPAGTSLGYKTVPAKPGDNVVLYGVGFGPTRILGSIPFSGPTDAIFAIHLTVNGQPLTTTYAGMSAPGLFQFNVTIPPGLGTGDQPLLGTVNGISTPTNVVITLQ